MMIKLGNCPYYNIEVFNIIKMAVDQGRHISSLKCKEWYTFLLNYELFESSPDGKLDLVPYRVQLQQPQWKLLHQLLPTKERQTRILRGGNDSLCTSCDMGKVDSLLDTLTACPKSRETFQWLKAELETFSHGLTAEGILKLDISISEPLPFNELPLVWFTVEVLKSLWKLRSAGKPCRLLQIKASVQAECEILKRSNYSDVAVIIESMF